MAGASARTRISAVVLWALALPWALEAAAWPLAAPRAPSRHVVEIRGFVYSPATLSAAEGDTVVWINRDIVPHTATAENGAWDSGEIAPNGSWQHVFTAKGRARYLCALHPGMRAMLSIR